MLLNLHGEEKQATVELLNGHLSVQQLNKMLAPSGLMVLSVNGRLACTDDHGYTDRTYSTEQPIRINTQLTVGTKVGLLVQMTPQELQCRYILAGTEHFVICSCCLCVLWLQPYACRGIYTDSSL